MEPKLQPSTKDIINMAAKAAVKTVREIKEGIIPVAHGAVEEIPVEEDLEELVNHRMDQYHEEYHNTTAPELD